MNFLKCTHCGNKIMTYDTRIEDLEHYRQELLSEKENLQKKYVPGPSKSSQNTKQRIKYLNVKIEEIKKQVGVAIKIVNRIEKLDEISNKTDSALILALKEYVSKEQFLSAAEKANKIREQARSQKDDELRKIYGIEKQIKETRENRNSEGYIDTTAHLAINKPEKRKRINVRVWREAK